MTIGKLEWPTLHADLVAKRDALTQVIATIETHFIGDTPAEMPPSPVRAPKSKKPRQRRTEQRTAPARSFPDDIGDAILVALKGHSPQSPRELADAVQVKVPLLRAHLKGLVKTGRVTLTGKTMNRQVHLGRARPAKEVP
jgi:hypothetical protein